MTDYCEYTEGHNDREEFTTVEVPILGFWKEDRIGTYHVNVCRECKKAWATTPDNERPAVLATSVQAAPVWKPIPPK